MTLSRLSAGDCRQCPRASAPPDPAADEAGGCAVEADRGIVGYRAAFVHAVPARFGYPANAAILPRLRRVRGREARRSPYAIARERARHRSVRRAAGPRPPHRQSRLRRLAPQHKTEARAFSRPVVAAAGPQAESGSRVSPLHQRFGRYRRHWSAHRRRGARRRGPVGIPSIADVHPEDTAAIMAEFPGDRLARRGVDLPPRPREAARPRPHGRGRIVARKLWAAGAAGQRERSSRSTERGAGRLAPRRFSGASVPTPTRQARRRPQRTPEGHRHHHHAASRTPLRGREGPHAEAPTPPAHQRAAKTAGI